MRDGATGVASLRRRLLAFLVGSLALMVAGGGAVTYWVALRSVNNAYDRSLLDPALDIAENLRIDTAGAHVDLPRQALDALVYDQIDRVIFQVRSPENAIVDGARDLPPPPGLGPGQQAFFDTVSDGERIRVAAHRTASGYVVQVGETLHKRNRLVGEIMAAELVPTLLVAIAAIALAPFGVARGLRPLGRLRADLLGRSPRDLRPLPPSATPEIAPVVDAFNGLLDQVREATATRQRFLANAAHQLRTPLAGLQMHLELLLRRKLPGDVRGEVTRLHGATVRAARIANQLLALARAENAADTDRRMERVDLRATAGAAAVRWVPEARDRRIDLGFSLDCAEIDGDPVLLGELLDNLLDNALRYTPAGGAVTVHTGCRDDGAPFLCVEDTGPGIPAAERPRVRERFYRIPGTPGDGSGLGLAIVQEVVDRHRGTLDIDAPDAQGGARLCVRFPRAPAAA